LWDLGDQSFRGLQERLEVTRRMQERVDRRTKAFLEGSEVILKSIQKHQGPAPLRFGDHQLNKDPDGPMVGSDGSCD